MRRVGNGPDLAVDESETKIKGANSLKRNALGRGLSALMSQTAVSVFPEREQIAESAVDVAPAKDKEEIPPRPFQHLPHDEIADQGLTYLPIERVFPNESQPRKSFDQAELNELANSIRDTGLLQPILVRRKKGESGPLAHYEIVAGERRFRASQLAGLSRIPAIIKQLDDKQTFKLAIVENVQRTDLNPIEEALAYQRLIDEFGETQASVASAVGKDRVSVANTLRLLKLDPQLQQLLIEGKLTAGHGRALLMTEDAAQQRLLANSIINGSLSVRAAERLVSEGQKSNKRSAKQPLKQNRVVELEERLRRVLGTKVQLILKDGGGGDLRISFFSESDLQDLLERLGA